MLPRFHLLIALALCSISLAGAPIARGASAAAPQGEPVLLRDDFRAGARAWEPTGGEWSAVAGRYAARESGGEQTAFALHRRAPLLETQTVEATVNVKQRLAAAGWSMAGVSLFFDSSNFWLLSLTEDAQGRRYVDFLENCSGVWQAQSQAGSTKLTGEGARAGGSSWQPNHDYRLKLELSPAGIAATVADAASGQVLAQGRYEFGAADAVRVGMGGVAARGCAAAFDDFTVTAPAAAEAAPAGVRVEKGPRGCVAMLRDALPGMDRASVDRLAAALRAAGFGVTFLTAENASNPVVLSPQRFCLYVVPNAEVYPADGAHALMIYLRRHGNLILLGGPAFSRPVWRHQGEWIDRAEIRSRIAKQGADRIFMDFAGHPDLSAWTRATDNREIESRITTEATGPEGSSCLKVRMENLTGWNTYGSPAIQGMFPPGQDLFCFWAKGDAQTPQIAVEMGEKDQSRWIATVPLTPRWSYYVLSPDEFHYWHDAHTDRERGGVGDRLNPQQAVRVTFGLASSHTQAVGAGPHTFWVARLGSAANAYAGLTTPRAEALLPIETISPSYKSYPLEGIASLAAAPGQSVVPAGVRLLAPASTVSSFFRPTGKGFGNERKWRFVPLLQALDAKGNRRGTPAWILLNQALPFRESAFAVFGIHDQKLFASGPLRRAVVDTALRLRQGVFLSEGGARYFSYWPGEKVELGASVMDWGPSAAPVRVRFTVTTQKSGKRLFSAEQALALAPGASASLTRAWNPGKASPGDCRVVTELLQGGKTIDRIEHTLGFLSLAAPRPDDFVTTKGSDFYLHGRKWYPVGVNYWPLYVSGLEPDDYNRSWFSPAFYDPEEVERDLVKMQALGINMVSIQMSDLRSQRNLLDFLRRCARHDIHVNGFLSGASPVNFNEQEAGAFIRAGKLDRNPVLFAYDIIWEPGNSMFNATGRPRWDADWEAWIIERYGSLAAAEADWGMSVPRTAEGRVTSPSDGQMRDDGKWRVMVAAYRRFMDDLMSRKWNDAEQRLRRLDPRHLISFRQGNTLPQDFAFTATPKHVDFMCPEGYSIPPGEAGLNAAGFITRYVAFTTRGKPIYWAEFGKSVWDGNQMRPDPQGIKRQGEYSEVFYRTVLEAGANATAPWWWPGGYRVNEKSDFGIMNPDGTPRPAAQLIARYGAKLKTPRTVPTPNTWLIVDRDAHPGGYWHIVFNEGARTYARARQEGKFLGVRTDGTGTDSCTTPLLAVGNRPYNGRNPMKYLNAEFNHLEILDRDGRWVEAQRGAEIPVAAGKPVRARVSVGNTQEATWLTPASAGTRKGAVFLASATGSGVQVHVPVPKDTPCLSDADFGEITLSPGLTGKTRVVLQMTAEGRASFGEKREFTLVAE